MISPQKFGRHIIIKAVQSFYLEKVNSKRSAT